jgi:predicted DNA-binding protein with PD1-like motif
MIGARPAWMAALFVCTLGSAGEAEKVPRVFGGAAPQEIYRVRLDKGDLLLESIAEILQSHQIRDGAVLTGVGQLSECTFHAAGSSKIAITEPMQLTSLGGLIADSATHLHAVFSSPAKGTFGGHLEKGCVVANQVELTIMKFSGVPLTRKKVKGSGSLLQRK